MSADPDMPPTDPSSDAAMMNTAHTLRIYFLALVAEGFDPAQALHIATNYQANLLMLAAAMPPIDMGGPQPQAGAA